MKVLAIIPARGGSKGVPGKNKMDFGGKSLVEYTIETALEAKFIDKIIVTSDDEDILLLTKNYSNSRLSQHKRDRNLASDTSPIIETIKNILLNESQKYDYLLLLQPTAPLRKSDDLDKAIQILNTDTKINSVVSVIPMDDIHPARMYWKNKDSILKPIMQEFESSRRQDIPKAYYRNGCIYLSRVSELFKSDKVITEPVKGYVMRYEDWLNIDDQRDVLLGKSLIPLWYQKLSQ